MLVRGPVAEVIFCARSGSRAGRAEINSGGMIE
jgi:hypothetical protein